MVPSAHVCSEGVVLVLCPPPLAVAAREEVVLVPCHPPLAVAAREVVVGRCRFVFVCEGWCCHITLRSCLQRGRVMACGRVTSDSRLRGRVGGGCGRGASNWH